MGPQTSHKNIVCCRLITESDCNPKDGEYTLEIVSFVGSLDISVPGGLDDPTLIYDCVAELIDGLDLPEEGVTELILKETGEWEDVFYNKYYEMESFVRYPTV